MKKKYNLLRLLPMLLGLIGIVSFIFYNNNLNNKFINYPVNDIIIKKSNWQLRATEFYLKNGLRIDSSYVVPFDLKIGDSISKKANMTKFDVYRKNEGDKYEFYKSYNIK